MLYFFLFPFSPPYFTLVPYFLPILPPHSFIFTYVSLLSCFFPFFPPIHSNLFVLPFSLSLPILPALAYSIALLTHTLTSPHHLSSTPYGTVNYFLRRFELKIQFYLTKNTELLISFFYGFVNCKYIKSFYIFDG